MIPPADRRRLSIKEIAQQLGKSWNFVRDNVPLRRLPNTVKGYFAFQEDIDAYLSACEPIAPVGYSRKRKRKSRERGVA